MCDSQNLLPLGPSALPSISTLKTYCPTCKDVYAPPMQRHEDIDGSAFGPNFAHMFVKNFPTLFPPAAEKKVPFKGTAWGYKFHASASTHPPKLISRWDRSGIVTVATVANPRAVFAPVDSNTVLKYNRSFVVDLMDQKEQ